jgi:hypothetical protein
MKSRDILLLAGIGLLAWYLLRDKKKPLMKEDLSAGKGGSDAPPFKGGEDKKPSPYPPYRLRKNPLQVDDFSKKQPVFVTPKLDVMPDVLKPELKEPISMPAANLIPNVYDRGVNQPLPDKYYASFAGTCSENIQSACKCTSKKSEKYQIDLPKLP